MKIFLFILLIFGIYKGIQIHHDVKQVMQYRSLVREVLAEEDTTANENLILAMIYTETKGREDDVMGGHAAAPSVAARYRVSDRRINPASGHASRAMRQSGSWARIMPDDRRPASRDDAGSAGA